MSLAQITISSGNLILFCFFSQTQILAKDVITCDDALYTLREQISGKKEEIKLDDITRVHETYNFKHSFHSKVSTDQFQFCVLEKSSNNTIRTLHFHS